VQARNIKFLVKILKIHGIAVGETLFLLKCHV